jgi:hypothetical protein
MVYWLELPNGASVGAANGAGVGAAYGAGVRAATGEGMRVANGEGVEAVRFPTLLNVSTNNDNKNLA